MLREGKNIFLARQFSARPRQLARRGHGFHTRPSLSEVSHIIDSIYHNKLILSLSVSCKQLAGLHVVSNSFDVVIFWGIKLGDSKI